MNLNWYRPFRQVIKQARDIVFASGTLKPLEDYKILENFFSNAEETKVNEVESSKSKKHSSSKSHLDSNHFSWGHIIPKSNLSCKIISHYSDKVPYSFTFKNRENPTQIKALGEFLLKLVKNPEKERLKEKRGIVVFLQSYEFKKFLIKKFIELGILEKIRTDGNW